MSQFTVEGWVIIIGAIGVVVNNIISNWKMSTKVDAVVQTTKVIEGHVNSATALAKAEKDAGLAREVKLQEIIDELKRTAAVLAQALAIKDASNTIPLSALPGLKSKE